MANSLSQFIGEIRKSRNDELAQMLSSALPFMQYEIEQERNRKQYSEQLGRYRTDLSKAITDPDLRGEFDGMAYETMEGAQLGFANIMNKQKYRGYGQSVLNSYKSILDPEDLAKVEAAISSSQNPEELDGQVKAILSTAKATPAVVNRQAEATLNPEALANYQQLVSSGVNPASALVQASQQQETNVGIERNAAANQAELDFNRRNGLLNTGRGRSGTREGTPSETQDEGPGQMKVNDSYRRQREAVTRERNGKKYVYMRFDNGQEAWVEATIGNDERLYLVGERGNYPANPYQFTTPPRGMVVLPTLEKSRIDKWNSGGTQDRPDQESQGAIIGIDADGNPIYSGRRQ